MKNRKKTNKKSKIIFLYYLIIIIILLIGYTYSKYFSVATSNPQIDVALFKFKIGENESENIEINLKDTIQENMYSNDTIIPGTNGKLVLKLNFSEINVTTNYKILLDTENTKIPENMKLYTDPSCTVEFNGYTGTSQLDNTEITRNIYWKWNYVTTDETTQWMGKEIKLVFNVQAEQRTN